MSVQILPPRVPSGLAQAIELYGDPRKATRLEWETSQLMLIELPFSMALSWDTKQRVSRVRVHRKAAPMFRHLFDTLHKLGLGDRIKTFGGVFEWRPVRGSSAPSTHMFGIGIDIDVEQNPLGQDHCTIDPEVVAVFAACGFVHGLRWRRPDPMHFQLADGI